MAALIWDNELQAWKEAATPQIWDPALGAYEDSTGLAWNPELGAWEGCWDSTPDFLYLYNCGDECSTVTGGWGANRTASTRMIQMTKTPTGITLVRPGSMTWAIIGTNNAVDLTHYAKLGVEASVASVLNSLGTAELTNPFPRVTTSADFSADGIHLAAKRLSASIKGRLEYTLDISDVAGGGYITFLNFDNHTIYGTILRVWLEK